MSVLERPELEASPLADLHAIANQIGLDGFRRLRKADLIDAILGEPGESAETDGEASGSDSDSDSEAAPRRRRPSRSRRSKAASDGDEEETRSEPASASGAKAESSSKSKSAKSESDEGGETSARANGSRRGGGERGASAGERSSSSSSSSERGGGERSSSSSERGSNERGGSERSGSERPAGRRERGPREASDERTAEGVVELLGNGSAFLRVDPPDPSDEDVYISAAQVRRCELVSGDRVSGPVRTPRRSERYPSLARIDTINGASADSVAEGTRYDDLPVVHPSERLELDPKDPTLKAIEWLTPLGRGSRAVIVGAARSGKTETLRLILGALAGREGLELSLVLSGIRPEEATAWQEGPLAPASTHSFAVSADSQGQALEHAIESARRVAARGGHAVVLIDSLDGVHPHAARKALASARRLAGGGSLTVIATAGKPFGGESTVIALDVALTSTGRLPALDLGASGTIKPELLVGDTEAAAITKARAKALA